VDQELLNRWEQFTLQGDPAILSSRDIRNLCWEPRVVADTRFQKLLERHEKALPGSAIEGLIFSYHSEYRKLAGNEQLEAFFARLINGRSEFIPRLKPWSSNLSVLLGADAAKRMSSKVSIPGSSFQQSFEAQRVYPNTIFAGEAASLAIFNYISIFPSMTPDEVAHFYEFILPDAILSKEVYKKALSELILLPIHERNEALRGKLLAYTMTVSGLRDPRIHREAWIGIDEAAKQRVIQWLSSQEIEFFFGLLIGRTDRHGRKAFWMEYVSQVSRSRALLCLRDREAHHTQLRELAERGTSYANLKSGASSAFILDFSKIVVVEFSTVGCVYLYTRSAFDRIVRNFWTTEARSDELKRRDLAIDYISHTADWEQRVVNVLSRNGIRR
jgi:hypothetical protein